MKRQSIAALAVVGFCAGAVAENIATWSWRVEDTAGNVGFVAPGESAFVYLTIAFDPPQPQEGGGFAGTDVFHVRGNEAWANGDVVNYGGFCWFNCGLFHPHNNDITHIVLFQTPLIGNPTFNSDNPLDVFGIQWTPDSYDGQIVTLNSDAVDTYIYIDKFGTVVAYAGVGGIGSFVVVPSPGGLAALTVAAIAAAGIRRRRG